MPINPANVAQAYLNTIKSNQTRGLEARQTGDGFGSLLDQVGRQVADAARKSEAKTVAAVSGKADVGDVVTAVSNAEVALQTVVAVRDRVIQAYEDIIRMPI